MVEGTKISPIFVGRVTRVDDTNYEINEDDDEFPEECYICGKPFTSPVVTRPNRKAEWDGKEQKRAALRFR
ncbi:hypothetical protein ANCDUO_16606 [Ancylostoma duodenale]|uniref:Uncharacterized protein n=1 Tax=Ancylostoma duodenale TaxID=51022 RepID=A0A0C2CAD5_9BILA|nr:hypothetical protein ANCDUO_16606 [Ancylostoma duodenale]